MGGLSLLLIALLAGMFLAVLALYLVQRMRMRRLARQAEDFLSCGGEALDFSVREDGLAELHNAVAELQNRLLLSREREIEECRRTSNLTADISHQLKTPLASLRLFCEMDEGAHMAEQIGQIERMEQLIYSLLRLERLCADGYDFQFAEQEVREVVEDAWDSLREVFPTQQVHIEGSAVIRCDAKWLGEAFLNLLKNACEHTGENGHIRVRMEISSSTFFCTVEDEGGGVAPRDLPRLFERFYRAESRESKGAGIGLSIVQAIIHRHHGDIHAENTSRGLRMCMSIPILNLAKS